MPVLKPMPLSFEQVSSKLSYDPVTGKITWLVAPNRRLKAGAEAGCVKGCRTSIKTGATTRYRYIIVDGWEAPAARFAWLLQTGEWPNGSVLFDDGNPANMVWTNLRQSKTNIMSVDAAGRRQNVMPKEARRHYGLKRYYGLSIEEYNVMLANQNGVCAICARPEKMNAKGKIKPLSVDHDHQTGAIRALLCSDCNTGLGAYDDNPERLEAAAAYIDRNRRPPLTVVKEA